MYFRTKIVKNTPLVQLVESFRNTEGQPRQRVVVSRGEWALIDWAERTSLPELLDLRLTKTTKDRLCRTSDKLLGHREIIERKLRNTEQTLFSSRRKLVLYDVTNTPFEGLCEANQETLSIPRLLPPANGFSFPYIHWARFARDNSFGISWCSRASAAGWRWGRR